MKFFITVLFLFLITFTAQAQTKNNVSDLSEMIMKTNHGKSHDKLVYGIFCDFIIDDKTYDLGEFKLMQPKGFEVNDFEFNTVTNYGVKTMIVTSVTIKIPH